ncbi:hypothetical protein D3C78_1098090 [compost metagenome]
MRGGANLRQGGFDKRSLCAVGKDCFLHLSVRHLWRVQIDEAGSAFDACTIVVDKWIASSIQFPHEIIVFEAQPQRAYQYQPADALRLIGCIHAGDGSTH